ncbi:MAG: hypothetical protein U1F60_10350 [Planctomycetota bacterium]
MRTLRNRSWSLLLTVLSLGLCGCGGGERQDAVGGADSGTVHVVFDPATGADGLVTFEVVAAAFETAAGDPTTNLLGRPETLTLADPGGEVAGLRLDGVPAGDYARLHLVLTPSSGRVLFADGSVEPVSAGVDLVVPIAEGLQHGAAASWLVVGHNRTNALQSGLGGWQWVGDLRGRADDFPVELGDLVPVVVAPSQLVVRAPFAGDGRLAVAFAAGCTFGDDLSNAYSTRNQFQSGLSSAFDVRLRGELGRDGTVLVHHARRGRADTGARLFGRITALEPTATSFVLQVQAEIQDGERHLLSPARDVLVRAAQARLQRHQASERVLFPELHVGDAVRVKWQSTAAPVGGLDVYVAREVLVTAEAGVATTPEWEGLLQTRDLGTRVLGVEALPGDVLLVAGVPTHDVLVAVDQAAELMRREVGGGIVAITLADVVAGGDSIVWRGAALTPTVTLATSVRVRTR